MDSKKKRVLVVDDSHDVVSLIETILDHYGHDAVIVDPDTMAADPVGVALVTGTDVLLLNLHMPHASGWDILERLRSDDLTTNLPVVLSTADERAIKLGRARAHDLRAVILPRPFQVDALLRAIDRAAEQRGTLSAA